MAPPAGVAASAGQAEQVSTLSPLWGLVVSGEKEEPVEPGAQAAPVVVERAARASASSVEVLRPRT